MSAVPGPPAPDPESMDILASAAMDAQRRGFERLCLICLHGFNGATCPRCPLTSGPPAPDPRWPASDMLEAAWGLIANASGGDWTKASPEWQAAAARWRDAYVAGAAVPAPPAGLTVAQLADLLWEGSWELDLDPPARAMMEKLAAWLAPRLSGSPGAPPAARRAPTEAMIDAAYEVLMAYWPIPPDPQPRTRKVVERMLRAAQAADVR